MLDNKEMYGGDTPRSPGTLRRVLVERGEDVIEMSVFNRWLDGKTWRYNLVAFAHGTIHIVLRGWHEKHVTAL